MTESSAPAPPPDRTLSAQETAPAAWHVPAALREYFEAIEDFVATQRGQPLILSPQDFARVFAWWDAGIPVAAVIEGLGVFFTKKKRKPGAKIYTLAYADREVAAALAAQRRRALGSDLGMAVDETAELRARLQTLAARLRVVSEPAPLAQASTRAADELQALAEKEPAPALAAVSRRLSEIDRELIAVAGSLLSPTARKNMDTEITQQLGELAIALSDDAMRALLNARKLREKNALPRLGLYG